MNVKYIIDESNCYLTSARIEKFNAFFQLAVTRDKHQT